MPPSCRSPGRDAPARTGARDRKSTRLNSSHTVIYTLSLHDALPISRGPTWTAASGSASRMIHASVLPKPRPRCACANRRPRSEEHTSELQSHSDLHSFPTRRSSDLARADVDGGVGLRLEDDPCLRLAEAQAEMRLREPAP